jgi:sugar lactone lactonase YvrE
MDDGVAILDGPAPELLVDLPSVTGEGPLWHEDEQALYWVDIPPGRLYRYFPATGTNELLHQHDGMIGGFTLQADGSLLLFGDEGRVVRWQDGAVETVIDQVQAEAGGRFNDVEAGPDGQVYCGTMMTASGAARLYRLELDGTLTVLFDDIGLSNGIGYSPDNRIMYHTDTTGQVIYGLDYESGSGEIRNRQVLVRTPDGEGMPDGMTVDLNGDLWSARWDGHALYRYTATGELKGKVPFPARKVSSIAFGGERYDTAYVTTATGPGGRTPEEGDLAGSLFQVTLGVKGRAPFRSRIGL